MDTSNSGKLSKSDLISFLSLFLLGVIVFFGINLIMLGSFVPSIVLSIILVVLIMVFVFLAAFAKSQNRNQSTWTNIKYLMVALYIVAMVPCYFAVAKFCGIQFSRGNQETGIQADIQKDIDDINNLFRDFEVMYDTRCENLQTELEALSTYPEGRKKIIESLGLNKQPSEITKADAKSLTDSFRKLIMKDFNILKMDKDKIVSKCMSNLERWNLIFLPESVSELTIAKSGYISKLKKILEDTEKNPLEVRIPTFDFNQYKMTTTVSERFTDWKQFSLPALIITLLLAFLGLVKVLFGQSATIIPFKEGDATVITNDGGFAI